MTDVATRNGVAQCVTDSSPSSKMLIPQLVGNEQGQLSNTVQVFDWQEKFSACAAVPEIKKFHSMSFTSDRLGFCTCKYWSSDAEESEHKIFYTSEITTDMPAVIVDPGLSEERIKYLHKKI